MKAENVIKVINEAYKSKYKDFVDITSQNRYSKHVEARQIAVGLLMDNTSIGYKSIAVMLGRSVGATYLAEKRYREKIKSGNVAFFKMREAIITQLKNQANDNQN